MKVKEIKLCFENCEVYILKSRMLNYFSIIGITEQISTNSDYYKSREIHRIKQCEKLYIEVNQKGLEQKGLMENERTLEQRIKLLDITSIELVYEDNTKECIYVPWSEKEEYTNLYQENIYNQDNVVINIRKV